MRFRHFDVVALLAFAVPGVLGQNQQSAPASPDSGQVLFSRGADSSVPAVQAGGTQPVPMGESDPLGVSDAERSAITFTSYDLDAHLTPATGSLAVRAGVVVRNEGSTPLGRVTLQISSSLRWQAVSVAGHALPIVSRLIDTDADHTGAMDEAVITLPQPLAPGSMASITALYAGVVAPSSERLQRTGAPVGQARAADWDAIGTEGTFLRGFGYVLWYPVSEPAVMFRDGDRLFQMIGQTRMRDASIPARLRLAVEYRGEPPDAAFFCGRREVLKAISDNPDAPAAEAPGIAVAQFAAEPVGFRTPDLFITARPAIETGTQSNPNLLAAVTTRDSAVAAYTSAATELEPLLIEWFGQHPISPLYLIDHPGQPFEDQALVVRPLAGSDMSGVPVALAHSLTHAWIHSTHPWIEEGLAEFSRLLWVERVDGHDAALSALQEGYRNLAKAEQAPHSDPSPSSVSSSSNPEDMERRESLIDTTNEVFYRTKAAAVWWMLRGIVGDSALEQSLHVYRSDRRGDRDPDALERTVEKFSHKDLRWFFDDWVYHDRGLPHLSITAITPSELKGRTGVPDGWLIAVEVRNDGDAVADVPITVRSAASTQHERLRIPARSSASTRIVFAGVPEEVIVNDGSVPESGPTVHTRKLTVTK